MSTDSPKKIVPDQVILTIHNAHYAPCPLDFAPKDAYYISYFEGFHGDQWVLRWDGSDHVDLAGGDVDWKSKRIPVGVEICEVWILGDEEQLWFTACMRIVNQRAKFLADRAKADAA